MRGVAFIRKIGNLLFDAFLGGVRFLLDSYAQDRMQVPLGESEDKHLCSKHSSLKYVKCRHNSSYDHKSKER